MRFSGAVPKKAAIWLNCGLRQDEAASLLQKNCDYLTQSGAS